MVGAVYQVLQCLSACGRTLGQSPAPVSAQIPVRATDARNVPAKHHPHIRAGHARGAVADSGYVIETDAAARAIHRRQRRTRNLFAHLFVQRVAFGEGDHGRIGPGRAQRTLLYQRLGIARGEVSQISDLDRPLRRMNVGHGGGFGDRVDLKLGDDAGIGSTRAVALPRRQGVVSDLEFHPFLQAGGATTIQVGNALRHVFHSEYGVQIWISAANDQC